MADAVKRFFVTVFHTPYDSGEYSGRMTKDEAIAYARLQEQKLGNGVQSVHISEAAGA